MRTEYDMKNLRLLILAPALWLATVVHGWSEQENGLLVYEEPPGTYVEVLRYTSITPGTAYAILISPSGGTRHCWNGGVLAQVDYPTGGVDPYDANQHIQQIRSLLTTYPQYKVQLQGALARWQNALSAAKQIKPAPEVGIAQGPTLPALTVKNVTYRKVTFAGISGNTVSITHSDGAASIQLVDLTDEQLSALNKTTASVHIDPDSWKKQQTAPWQKKAIAEFPALADANSDLNHKFIARVKELKSSNPASFNDPKWPYLLAQEVSKPIEKPVIPPAPEAIIQKESTREQKTAVGASIARGNLQRTGEYISPPITDSPILLWRHTVCPVSVPAVSNGLAYFSDDADHNFAICAVDEQDGASRWTEDRHYSNPGNIPVIAGNLAYFAGQSVYALDANTGVEERDYKTSDAADLSSPALDGRLLIFLSDDSAFAALDLNSGKQIWTTKARNAACGIAAIADGKVVYANSSGVDALDEKTGGFLFHFDTDFVMKCPAVSGNTIYFYTLWQVDQKEKENSGYLFAIDINSGKEKWRFKIGDNVLNKDIAVSKSLVYFCDNNGLHAIDTLTGIEKWRYNCLNGASGPSISSGIIYIGSSDGIHALDATTGDEKWFFPVNYGSYVFSAPVIADGIVYFLRSDNTTAWLYAIGK